MRIISGTARGRQLATFPGGNIRPTPDRVREALFSILTSRLGSFQGLRVLDLFSGTGAQALEALSRGAEQAVLVDSGAEAAGIIEENIRRCQCESNARLIREDAFRALPTLAAEPFDLILLDPPYRQGLIPQIIEMIESLNILKENGIICAESEKKVPSITCQTLNLLDDRVYGSVRIRLYGLPED